MISKVHSGHKHLYLHFPTDRNASAIQSEKIAVYNSKVSYMKSAIKYMFFANGGAITTALLNFKIEECRYPLLLFCVGISYTIFIPILMYFTTKIETAFLNRNIKINKHSKVKLLLLNFVIGLLMYLPVILFSVGLAIMYNISVKLS